jgi:hypothetical protein
MKCLGLHNKHTAEVHPGHMLTGPKEEEEEHHIRVAILGVMIISLLAVLKQTVWV